MRGTSLVDRALWTLGTAGNSLALSCGLTRGADQYRRFIVVAQPRSGSTMLVRTLSRHPSLVSYTEIFSRHFIGWGRARPLRFGTERHLLRMRQDDPVRFLQDRIWGGHARAIEAVGFKLLYNQVLGPEGQDIAEFLRHDRDVSIIHLTRRSLLREYLSGVKSQRTGVFQNDAGLTDYVDRPIALDPKAVVRYVVGMRTWRTKIDTMFEAHEKHQVEYAEMVTDWPGISRGIFDFLGVAPVAVQPAVERLSVLSLEESIENYQAVVNTLIDLGLGDENIDDSPV